MNLEKIDLFLGERKNVGKEALYMDRNERVLHNLEWEGLEQDKMIRHVLTDYFDHSKKWETYMIPLGLNLQWMENLDRE
jgi:hypothetical protein